MNLHDFLGGILLGGGLAMCCCIAYSAWKDHKKYERSMLLYDMGVEAKRAIGSDLEVMKADIRSIRRIVFDLDIKLDLKEPPNV